MPSIKIEVSQEARDMLDLLHMNCERRAEPQKNLFGDAVLTGMYFIANAGCGRKFKKGRCIEIEGLSVRFRDGKAKIGDVTLEIDGGTVKASDGQAYLIADRMKEERTRNEVLKIGGSANA